MHIHTYIHIHEKVDASSLQASLNAFSALYQVTRPFTVAGSTLQIATYTLTLTLTNFLGLTSFTSVVINVVRDPNIPLLSVIGPSYIHITAASDLVVLSAAKLSNCATTKNKIVYLWSLLNVNTGMQTYMFICIFESI
jgi:hypothetical protein